MEKNDNELFDLYLQKKIFEIAEKDGDTSIGHQKEILIQAILFFSKSFAEEKFPKETGIWSTVKELVVTHGQPDIAMQICLSNDIDKKMARFLEVSSGKPNDVMFDFIENNLK